MGFWFLRHIDLVPARCLRKESYCVLDDKNTISMFSFVLLLESCYPPFSLYSKKVERKGRGKQHVNEDEVMKYEVIGIFVGGIFLYHCFIES